MTRFVYVLPAGRLRWEVRVDLGEITEDAAEHDHSGPDSACPACQPLTEVLRDRMRWPSLHWGELHPDAYPSLARAVHEAGYVHVEAAMPGVREPQFYRLKRDAIIAARAIAILIGGEVQPHNRRGRIQDPDSYGNDPRGRG